LKKIIMGLIAALIFTLSNLSTPAAHAADIRYYPAGCNGSDQSAVLKREWWTSDSHYVYSPGYPNNAHYKLWGATDYYYCRDSSGPEKVKAIRTKFCAEKLDNNEQLPAQYIRGFSFNPYYATLSNSVDPVSRFLNWDGTGTDGSKACVGWDSISDNINQWFWLSAQPFWTVSGFTNIANSPDDDWNFTLNGTRFRYFTPGADDSTTL
jgi:hypothetical protein